MSERFPVGELSHRSKSSSMPLCKACPGCGGMIHIRKVSCSCGHVFLAKQNKRLLTSSRKHTLRSFRARLSWPSLCSRHSLQKVTLCRRILKGESILHPSPNLQPNPRHFHHNQSLRVTPFARTLFSHLFLLEFTLKFFAM